MLSEDTEAEAGRVAQLITAVAAQPAEWCQVDELARMLDRIYEAGDLPLAVGQQVRIPAPRRGSRAAHRVPREKRWLRVVPGFIPVALGALRAAFKASWIAHPAATVAAGTATVATAALVTTAAVSPHGPVASVLGVGSPATPNPVAGIYSASPITAPSSPLKLAAITGAVTKPRLDADGLAGQVPPSLAAPYLYVPSQPSQSSPSYQQPVSSQQSQQGGSVQIAVSTTAPDLSSGAGSVTITLTASGDGGWAAWKVDATDPATGAAQTDLDFSPSHGVLRPGQEAQVVVTLDASLDEAPAETFEIAGQQVTIALPGPPPAPAVAPSPVDTSLPVVVPTPDPSAS